jgi:hypothetical protein
LGFKLRVLQFPQDSASRLGRQRTRVSAGEQHPWLALRDFSLNIPVPKREPCRYSNRGVLLVADSRSAERGFEFSIAGSNDRTRPIVPDRERQL